MADTRQRQTVVSRAVAGAPLAGESAEIAHNSVFNLIGCSARKVIHTAANLITTLRIKYGFIVVFG